MKNWWNNLHYTTREQIFIWPILIGICAGFFLFIDHLPISTSPDPEYTTVTVTDLKTGKAYQAAKRDVIHHWRGGVTIFDGDGRIEIDNSFTER